ncbi:MAG: hypothetical protein AAGF31_03325 [Planctomycetota bacterium]
MLRATSKIVVEHQKVLKRVRQKRNRVLYRTGGYLRTSQRRRIRNRKRPSKPGEGPTNRQGRLKAGIKFDVDEFEGTVVAGITPNATASGAKALAGKTIPQVIDEGGDEILTDSDGEKFMAHFEPRPITDPVRPAAEQFFQDQIEKQSL